MIRLRSRANRMPRLIPHGCFTSHKRITLVMRRDREAQMRPLETWQSPPDLIWHHSTWLLLSRGGRPNMYKYTSYISARALHQIIGTLFRSEATAPRRFVFLTDLRIL